MLFTGRTEEQGPGPGDESITDAIILTEPGTQLALEDEEHLQRMRVPVGNGRFTHLPTQEHAAGSGKSDEREPTTVGRKLPGSVSEACQSEIPRLSLVDMGHQFSPDFHARSASIDAAGALESATPRGP